MAQTVPSPISKSRATSPPASLTSSATSSILSASSSETPSRLSSSDIRNLPTRRLQRRRPSKLQSAKRRNTSSSASQTVEVVSPATSSPTFGPSAKVPNATNASATSPKSPKWPPQCKNFTPKLSSAGPT